MKKILSLLLVLSLILTTVPAFAFASEEEFEIEDGVLVSYNGPGGNVVIPDGVTDVGNVFSECNSLISVTIPGSVKSIEHYAFGGCKNLENVVIEDGVESLNGIVFADCVNLRSISIPKSVKDIEVGTNNAFGRCYNLVEINVNPSNPIYSSYDGALYSKDCLELILVPGGKTEVLISPNTQKIAGSVKESANWRAKNAFPDCVKLEKIGVENGNSHFFSWDGVLYSIEERALLYCPANKSGSLSIPDGVEILRTGSLIYSYNITEIFLPKSISSYDVLQSANTTNAITRENHTLEDCYAFPSSVRGFGVYGDEYYDNHHSKLKGIYVDKSNPYFCDIDGVLFDKSVTEMLIYPFSRESDTFFIPETVTTIKDYTFRGSPLFPPSEFSLKKLVVPKSVKNVFVGALPGIANCFMPWISADIYGDTDTYAEKMANYMEVPFHTDRPSEPTYATRPVPPYTPDMDTIISGGSSTETPAPTNTPTPTATPTPTPTPTSTPTPIPTLTPTPIPTSSPSPTAPVTTTDTSADGTVTTTTTWPDGKTFVDVKSPNGDKKLTVTNGQSEKLAEISIPSNPGPGKSFTDVSNSAWYKDDVAAATSLGLFAGTGPNQFSPDLPMTRGMLATVLYRLSGNVEYGLGTGKFSDVSGKAWYKDSVDWAQATGVVAGIGGGKYGPDNNITREQLVTMLYNYAELIGKDSEKTADISRYSDGGKVSSYAKKAMSWAVAEGFVSGVGNNRLNPKGNATRAQVAAVLTRFVNYLKK